LEFGIASATYTLRKIAEEVEYNRGALPFYEAYIRKFGINPDDEESDEKRHAREAELEKETGMKMPPAKFLDFDDE